MHSIHTALSLPAAAGPASGSLPFADSCSPALLATRILAGDREAEEELVAHYYSAVHRALGRLVRGREKVEDLLQETFQVALVKLRGGQLAKPASLPSFLTSLARNLAINQHRIKTRRRTDADSEVTDNRACTAPGPLGQMLATEQAELVRRVLAELETPRDREILFRFYIKEEDKSTICEELKLSSLHFNRVLYRARQRYKQLFEERAGRVSA